MKTVLEHFGVTPRDGEVGLEIEMESDNVRYPDIDDGKLIKVWKAMEDPSLRGMALEYVLLNPSPRDEVANHLRMLEEFFCRWKIVLRDTDRCGVHVHINCQQLTFKQTINFITLYLIFEDLLVKWCGEDREGNLFCLRAKDAEYIITFLQKLVLRDGFFRIDEQQLRYSSINIAALAKYGSIEFRAMATPNDLSLINTWVEMLLAVKDASLNYNETYEMVEGLSASNSTEAFIRMVFNKHADQLLCKQQDKLLMEGVRRVQDLAYLPKIMKARNKNKPKAKRTNVFDDPGNAMQQMLYTHMIPSVTPGVPQPSFVPQPAWYDDPLPDDVIFDSQESE